MTPAELAAAGWPRAAQYLDTLQQHTEPEQGEPALAELKASLDNLTRNIDLLIRKSRREEEDPDGDNWFTPCDLICARGGRNCSSSSRARC